MASKQQFLSEKLSKFNSTLHSDSFIEYQILQIVGPFTPCHHSVMAPYKITQYYAKAAVALDF